MGTGGFAEPPKQTAAYRRGYLCGLIRGDGNAGHYSYPQLDRPADRTYLFRLPLAGQENREGLTRTAGYLARAGIGCVGFSFAEEAGTAAHAGGRELTAVRTGSAEQVRALGWLLDWPDDPGPDWHKGFLAGIFDAHGSYRDGVLLLAPADPAINGWLVFSLESLGFGFSVERPAGRACVRVRGGLAEALRFFHTVDPAVTIRRSIEAVKVETGDDLRVAGIERLGLHVPMYDITTGTGDFIANGVVSHNCFARKSHTYLDLDAGADFNTRVVVKVNAPELVRKKMASPSWQREHISVGMNVDCYQRAEGRYQLMPGIIRALSDAANPFSILTKGTLILRDIELLAEAAEVTEVGLNVSAGFVDKDLWRSIEPGTPAPARRLEACAALNERGLRCGVLMGPVVPFLSDSPAQLDEAVRQIAAAGATHVSAHRAAPAPRHARVVLRLAAGAASRAGRPVPRPVRRRCLRPEGVPEPDRRPGPRARRKARRRPAAPPRARPPDPQHPQRPQSSPTAGAAQTPVGRPASHGIGETRLAAAPGVREPRQAPQVPAPRKRAAEPPEQLTCSDPAPRPSHQRGLPPAAPLLAGSLRSRETLVPL